MNKTAPGVLADMDVYKSQKGGTVPRYAEVMSSGLEGAPSV
jgi:hypothetical protein